MKAGVNPNVSDFKGLTPLMTASMFGKTSTASFLLGMGALHHLTDINGDTALHWASYKGHPELIRLLLYSGADLTKADNFGSTPLHLAALSGSAKCVEILCQNVRKIPINQLKRHLDRLSVIYMDIHLLAVTESNIVTTQGQKWQNPVGPGRKPQVRGHRRAAEQRD